MWGGGFRLLGEDVSQLTVGRRLVDRGIVAVDQRRDCQIHDALVSQRPN